MCAALAATASTASAVVGAHRVAPTSVPTFAAYACGGTLIAPDRVVTALHCIAKLPFASYEQVTVGGHANRVADVAMHPSFRKRDATNYVHDVAILRLAAPVVGVTPATLGTAAAHVGEIGVIVGNGRSVAPGNGGGGARFGGGLRAAELKVLSDADCMRAFGTAKGNDGETFLPGGAFCAIDEDGKAPLSSGCNGDSGGPLLVGAAAAPVLLGVVSYGGLRCGADHLPSVFADVSEVRSFLTDPAPTWAPKAPRPAYITGGRTPGGTLTCHVPGVPPGAGSDVSWKRFARHGAPRVVGHARSLKVRAADRGARFLCIATVVNAGGFTLTPDGPDVIARIR